MTTLLLSASAWAGLGQISVRSHLGEPFRAVVSLSDSDTLSLGQARIGLANRATFDDLNVDYEPVLAGLRFSLQPGANGQQVVIRSQVPIRSSYLRFVLELKSPAGRWVREYTVLLDSGESSVVAEADPVQSPADRGALASRAGQIRVPSGGTLASVAAQVKPAGISLNQTMAGLFLANPAQFRAKDPLRLRKGAVLKIPPVASMRSLSDARARLVLQPPGTSPQVHAHPKSATLATAPADTVQHPAKHLNAHKVEPSHKLELPKQAEPAPAPAPAAVPAVASAPQAHAALQAASSPAASDASSEKIKTLQQQVAERAAALKSANQHITDLKLKIKALEASQAKAAVAGHGFLAGLGKTKLIAIAASVSVLLLGLLFWWWRRRRKKAGPVKPAAARHPLATTGVAPADQVPGVTGDGDPLAEAEVYLAYGHEEQAEAILKKGLEQDPSRQDIRGKLLELYAARPDPMRFEALAREVHDAYDGRGAMWERTRAMGLTIDPDNPFYQPDGLPEVMSVPTGDAAAADDPAQGAMLDFDMADDAEAVVAEPEVAAVADKDALLDFDFSLEGPASTGDAAEPSLAADSAPPEPAQEPALEPAPGVSEAEEADLALQAMGFDLDAAPVAEPVPAPEAVAENPVEPAPESVDSSASPTSEPSASEDSAPSGTNIASDTEPPLHVEVIEHDDAAAEEPVDDHLATKLDLARVYLDMGDSEGAREVLLELQKEAQGALKQQAEAMLAQLPASVGS